MAFQVFLKRYLRRLSTHWQRGVLVLFMLAGGLWLLRDREAEVARMPAAEHASLLSVEHGIEIQFGPPETFFTPPYHSSDVFAEGFSPQPADPQNAAIALDGIDRALAQYPPGFVAKMIQAIFICGELRLRGALAGGTAGPAWIVLSAAHDLRPQGIEYTSYIGVHHELSSHVLKREPVTLSAWRALEPLDAEFVVEADAALALGGSSPPDISTGFLTAYGATNPENDFNTYAEKMFSEPATVSKLAQQHAIVREKVEFVCATYIAIDARLAQTFRGLGLPCGDSADG